MMLLKLMPLLFRVHPLHLIAEGRVLLSKYLEPLEEPIESLHHCCTALLPKDGSYLLLLIPPRVFLLRVVPVELRVLVIAGGHHISLLEELRVGVDVFLYVEGRRLYERGRLREMDVFVGVGLRVLGRPCLLGVGNFLRVILLVVALRVILLGVHRIVLLLLSRSGVTALHGGWLSVHAVYFYE